MEKTDSTRDKCLIREDTGAQDDREIEQNEIQQVRIRQIFYCPSKNKGYNDEEGLSQKDF